MDLKIKDVAELLHVSEKTITRLISQKNIPYYLIGNQYRFNRSELNEWMLTNRGLTSAEVLKEVASESRVNIVEYLRRGGIYYKIPGECPEAVIRNAMSVIDIPVELNREATTTHLLNREALAPTAVGSGIAIPHPRTPILAEIANERVALCFLADPVDFKALDGQPVRVMFIVFSANQQRHHEILFNISSLCLDNHFLELLSRCPSLDEITTYIEARR
jgi:PTS system nitrogen regulatory IIA component